MDARSRGQGRGRSASGREPADAGRSRLPPRPKTTGQRPGASAADLSIAQLEPLFRAAMQRSINGGRPSGRIEASRSMWRIFRDCLRRLESAQAGAQEAAGAFTRLNQFLEEDRRRLAHELHDESAQLLAGIHIALSDLASDLGSAHRQRLREIRGQLDRVQDQIRRISHELRPTVLEDYGLVAALKFLAEGISTRSGIEIAVKGSTGGRLAGRIEMTLYRVVQEALNNAAKHAHASRVQIRLRRYPRFITCSVHDDGVGLEESLLRKHGGYNALGLLGIRVRVAALNGSIRIDSRHGAGTHLKVTLPLEE